MTYEVELAGTVFCGHETNGYVHFDVDFVEDENDSKGRLLREFMVGSRSLGEVLRDNPKRVAVLLVTTSRRGPSMERFANFHVMVSKDSYVNTLSKERAVAHLTRYPGDLRCYSGDVSVVSEDLRDCWELI